jgi:hypothetical protein
MFYPDVSDAHRISAIHIELSAGKENDAHAPPFFPKVMVTDACFSLSRKRGRRDGETIIP